MQKRPATSLKVTGSRLTSMHWQEALFGALLETLTARRRAGADGNGVSTARIRRVQLDVAAARFVIPAENPLLAVTYSRNTDTECVVDPGFASVADLDVDKVHFSTIDEPRSIGDPPALVPARATAVVHNVLRSDVTAAFTRNGKT